MTVISTFRVDEKESKGNGIGICRVSTPGQANDKFVSFETQEAVIKGGAVSAGCILRRISKVVGSAWTAEKEYVYRNYIEIVENTIEELEKEERVLTHVIFPWVDRGFRSSDTFMQFVKFCRNSELKISFSRENIHDVIYTETTPEGNVFFQINYNIVCKLMEKISYASISSLKKSVKTSARLEKMRPEDKRNRTFGFLLDGNGKVVEAFPREIELMDFILVLMVTNEYNEFYKFLKETSYDLLKELDQIHFPPAPSFAEVASILNKGKIQTRKDMMSKETVGYLWTGIAVKDTLLHYKRVNTEVSGIVDLALIVGRGTKRKRDCSVQEETEMLIDDLKTSSTVKMEGDLALGDFISRSSKRFRSRPEDDVLVGNRCREVENLIVKIRNM